MADEKKHPQPTDENDKEWPLGLGPNGQLNVVDPKTLDEDEEGDEDAEER